MNAHATVGRLFISVCVVVQSILLSPKYQAFIGDKEVFRYMGMLIRQGGVPYRDAFDHKPPVIYFLTAMTDFMGPWGLWLITTLLVLTAALFFYQACINLGAKLPVVYPLAFCILMRYGPIIQGGGLTREVTASLALILFSLCILTPARMLLFGALCALIFFTQQNELPAVMPLILLPLLSAMNVQGSLRPDWRMLSGNLIRIVCGGALVCLLIVAYFVLHRAVADFWQYAFIFNTTIYTDTSQPLLPTMRRLTGMLAHYRLVLPVTFLMLLGATGILFKHTSAAIRVILLAACAAIVLQLFSISLSNKYYGHYFISCIPYIIILMLGCGLFLQKVIPPRMAWIIPAALLLMVCIRHVEAHKFARLSTLLTAQAYEQKYPDFFFSDLQKLRGKAGSFYVFRNKDYLALNTDLHIIAPTKWIYDHMWGMFPDWDKDGKIFEGLLQDLHTADTEYILDFSPVFPLPDAKLQAAWDRFIESRYAVAAYIDDQNGNRIWNLYRLKSHKIQPPEEQQ